MYQTIAVAGLGLIGGSMVKAVREYLPQTRVLGYELRQEVCDRALEESTIQAANDWEGLRQADLLLLALFPGQAMDFAAAHASRLRPGCVVIDLCGVKEAVCPTLETNPVKPELMPYFASSLGTIPIATQTPIDATKFESK